ncbi:hypothetical protein SAMN06298216_4017 [Spirosomataceae bacterium TFI 002]|nr:hypothetical protein SAMN06298216_4017 [Spirosomataceae bacterium TFI 002]
MKILIKSLLLSLVTTLTFGQNDLINDALLPLDESDRAAATVLAFNEAGNTYTAKRGTNNYVCLADDPKKDGFSVACYHKELDAFMARGRELKLEGKGFKEIFDTRENEVKAGTLFMPDKASTLYILSGKTKEDANLRWVVYIPFATSESTGLPLKPLVPGGPWIMDPGTHRAHIMITPPSN